MSTLKSLLSAALDSHLKSEKEWVGKQGFRFKSFIAIVPFPGTTGQLNINYVPPCDGIIVVDDSGSDTDLFIQGELLVYSGKAGLSCRRSIYTRVSKGGYAISSAKPQETPTSCSLRWNHKDKVCDGGACYGLR